MNKGQRHVNWQVSQHRQLEHLLGLVNNLESLNWTSKCVLLLEHFSFSCRPSWEVCPTVLIEWNSSVLSVCSQIFLFSSSHKCLSQIYHLNFNEFNYLCLFLSFFSQWRNNLRLSQSQHPIVHRVVSTISLGENICPFICIANSTCVPFGAE